MISIRPFLYKDWQEYRALFADPIIEKSLPFLKPRSRIDYWISFILALFKLRSGLIYSQVILFEKKFIGVVFLEQYNPLHETANISFHIFPKYHGRGFGKKAVTLFCQKAFQIFSINRINAYVCCDNEKSIFLLKKIGFTQEAKLKQYLHFKGSLVDIYLFRLCRDEL